MEQGHGSTKIVQDSMRIMNHATTMTSKKMTTKREEVHKYVDEEREMCMKTRDASKIVGNYYKSYTNFKPFHLREMTSKSNKDKEYERSLGCHY